MALDLASQRTAASSSASLRMAASSSASRRTAASSPAPWRTIVAPPPSSNRQQLLHFLENGSKLPCPLVDDSGSFVSWRTAPVQPHQASSVSQTSVNGEGSLMVRLPPVPGFGTSVADKPLVHRERRKQEPD